MSRRIDTGDVEENTRPALENPKTGRPLYLIVF
jgi:hypothetical protein